MFRKVIKNSKQWPVGASGWAGVFIVAGALLATVAMVQQPLVYAETESNSETFGVCVAGLKQEALQQGIDANVVAVLDGVKELKRTIQLDRNQPEFVQTFEGYFSKRVTDYRVNRGRQMLRAHRELLERLSDKYGIPPQYLVAFWAAESNFGRYIGKIPVLDTLATLACDQRRSRYFAGELFAALQLMQKYGFEVEGMQGSWAGAIGQTQFMPSAFLQYGVDGDADNRVDLWQSEEDALTSAANFLNNLGWQRELRWGREVSLPANFAYEQAGPDNRQPLSVWKSQGVTQANGQPLPDVDISAALLVPAGADGPKFLAYGNFWVIMKWNRSIYYALSIGHLADRINGGGRLAQEPPKSEGLTKGDIVALQEKLATLGFDPGKPDGQVGPGTREAIRQYQVSTQVVADGYPDIPLFEALKLPLSVK